MAKQKNTCDLKSCTFCRLCLKEWLPAIDSNRKIFNYKKSERIFNENEVVAGMYFIYSGTVKVHKQWGDKELIVRFAKKGDIFGHRGLGNDTHYPISATALEPVTVCFIDLDFFKASLKVNHEYAYHLMMFFADELQESEKKMRDLAHMSVKGRIANALIRLKTKFGLHKDGYIDILLSRQDIASFAGTTYETVFRMLTEFMEMGIIKIDGKKITVIDENELYSLIAVG